MQSPIITDASAPYDSPDADAILRSCDNVDFRIIKVFLSFASPFFRGMFSLPQAPNGENRNEMRDGLPVITVTEASTTVTSLLSLCYPMAAVDPPELDKMELEGLNDVLEAAIKYDVERVQRKIRGWLVSPRFVATDPVRVFSIACRYQLHDEARLAATASLRKPSLIKRPYGTELESITGGQLYRLLQYHDACREAPIKAVSNLHWLNRTNFSWFACGHCPGNINKREVGPHRESMYCPDWLIVYTNEVAESFSDDAFRDKKRDTLMKAALNQALLCGWCGGRASMEVREFSDMLLARIQTVVSQVTLDIRL